MGTDTGYVKVAADPEQVDGTILDGRDYSSGQLPQENIRIIKEADATLRLNLGTIVLKKSPDQPSPDYPDKKKPPVHHG